MLTPANKRSASSIGLMPTDGAFPVEKKATSTVGLRDQASKSNPSDLVSKTSLSSSKISKANEESLKPSSSKGSLKVPDSDVPSRRSQGSHSRPASCVSHSTGIHTTISKSREVGPSQAECAAPDGQKHPSLTTSETQGSPCTLSHRDELEATGGAEKSGNDSNEISPVSAQVKLMETSSATATERSDTSVMDDDIFAPIDERVQTIDFSKILTQGIQITKNEQKKKGNVLGSLKKQVKNFFHEDRVGQLTDEQGNVELPMDPCLQARDDHDSGLLPSQRLFRLARHEQLQLQDRNLQHKQRSKLPPAARDNVDDYEFVWLVKRKTQSAAPSRIGLGDGFDQPDGITVGDDDKDNLDDDEAALAQKTTGNTHSSKVGSETEEFNQRIKQFLNPTHQGSTGKRSEDQKESELEKARKAQLLNLCGLVAAPTSDALSPEEQEARDKFWKELRPDFVDGNDEKYPCDCCERKELSDASLAFHSAAKYYDLLFAHRKNDSFTVRFDMVHCLPRFLLHYKFHKQLYDCLDASERRDLVKAAMDITMSYNVGNCTLQIPHGKYRTNAYPAFFAYIIVPDHARYLEIFEVCNPPAKPGMPRKKNSCVIPNWPDKSFLTEFWTYSNESTNPSDKDPRLTMRLYEKNVQRKVELVKMPELQVTRQKLPSELAKLKTVKQLSGDFDRFEDFVLIPHQEQAMLGFGSVHHPKHAKETRSPQPDIEFLHRLLQAMNSYVRRHINTRQRRLDGREDLSCTVNLSLHHSYTFKGHQRVYGFIGFPPASTYWAALVREQRRNAAVAETAVTQEDIRLMRAANARAKSNAAKSRDQEDREDGEATEASADRTEVNPQDETEILEKLKSCNFL